MKCILSPLLAALLATLLATPCFAKVVLTHKTTWYDVDGAGPSAISKHIKKHRYNGKNEGALAQTLSNINCEYSLVALGGECIVDKITVSLDLTFVYPRLTSKQDQRTQEWWDKIMKRVVKHEEHHAKIATDGANRLERALLALDSGDHATVKQAVKQTIKRIYDETNRQQNAFDEAEQAQGF